MHLSIGWIFLLGGIAGIVNNARAKTIAWANTLDVNMTDEQIRESEKLMTPKRRFVVLSFCFALAIFGAWKIQRDHCWNPFLGRPSNRQLTPQELKNDGAISWSDPRSVRQLYSGHSSSREVICSANS
jgi:hypothetical protein